MRKFITLLVALVASLVFAAVQTNAVKAASDQIDQAPHSAPQGQTGTPLFVPGDPLNGLLASGVGITTTHAPSRTTEIVSFSDKEAGLFTNPEKGRETYITLAVPTGLKLALWINDIDPKANKHETGWVVNGDVKPILADEWQMVGVYTGTVKLVTDDSGTVAGYLVQVPPTQQTPVCLALTGMPDHLSTPLGQVVAFNVQAQNAGWVKIREIGSDTDFGPYPLSGIITATVYPGDDYRAYVASKPDAQWNEWITNNDTCQQTAPSVQYPPLSCDRADFDVALPNEGVPPEGLDRNILVDSTGATSWLLTTYGEMGQQISEQSYNVLPIAVRVLPQVAFKVTAVSSDGRQATSSKCQLGAHPTGLDPAPEPAAYQQFLPLVANQ